MTTTRAGGYSKEQYSGLNLALHVNDNQDTVARNRSLIKTALNLPSEPIWLNQTHSTRVIKAEKALGNDDADGCITTTPNCVCCVMTADCLPVFIADANGGAVGLFHAGWRGLADGILDKAVSKFNSPGKHLVAALGPAISQSSFEVGAEVKDLFTSKFLSAARFFTPSQHPHRFYADLYGLAKLNLKELGIKSVWQPESVCTYKDAAKFYSYRRDGQTGRMASFIWMTD